MCLARTPLAAPMPRSPSSRLLLVPALVALVAGASVACSTSAPEDEPATAAAGDPGEADDASSAIVPIDEPDETAPPGALAPAPLDKDATDLVDLRGFGDSGWARTHESTPMAAELGKALDRFDPTGKSYRGDLAYVNWETVVGSGCTQFASEYVPGKNYAFVSLPENLVQANERGFDLIGLSNNHARDCLASPDTDQTGEVASADMTTRAIEALGDHDWAVAGLSSSADPKDFKKARVHAFQVKGREVKVAFGSLYMGRGSCPRTACRADADALMKSLRDAPADLRILALHSMGPTDQDDLVQLGVRFVKEFGGDVVFGSGPHVWRPVRVVRKNAGGKGVVFESVGNFLHPALAAQSKNFIGRALFDKSSLELRQVQLLPVRNVGTEVAWSNADASEVEANLTWTPSPKGVYANVKR